MLSANLTIVGIVLWVLGVFATIRLRGGPEVISRRLFWIFIGFAVSTALFSFRVLYGEGVVFGEQLFIAIVGMCAAVTGAAWLVSVAIAQLQPPQ